jgi:hypothetical protein
LNQAKSIDQALAEAFLKADQLAAPLDQWLKLYLGESRALLPDLESTYDQLVARIAANIRDSNQVPQVGEVLTNFCMTDSDGKLVDLAALRDLGPLVISFNRGPWCGPHAVAEIRVDEARLDLAVAADHPRRGNRQEPPAVSSRSLARWR